MATKKFFSWSSKSRHQSTQEKEPHYRTGGLLSIDALTSDPSPGDREPVREFNLPQDAKINSLSARKRPANLTIVPPNYETNQHAYLGSAAAPQNTALSSSTSNLLSFMNDMLRSPSPAANRSRSSSTVQKPLPGRPRSLSAPSTPDLPVELPVELPGSILQENQGYPSNPPSEGTSSRPISQQYRCDTEPPVDLEWLPPVDTDWLSQDFYDSFGITSDSLRQAKSVQDLSSLTVNMKSVRSGTTLNSSAASLKRHSSKSQHKRSLSETSVRGISRPNLTSNSSTDSKLTTCSMSSTKSSSNDSTKARVGAAKSLQPSPLIEEDQNWDKSNEEDLKHRAELDASTTSTPTPTPTPSIRRNSARVDELKATITAQDNTISTLQAQFGSLRASHEAHVASLADAHSAEVASLKSYTKALEEQLSQRSLHHASSNNLLFLLDTTDPQTPSRDGSQKSIGSGSATSAKSFQSALEQQGRSPSRETTEMENLKRKLSAARRPETGNRDAIRELNLFKQNNLALSKQIESLMAKLNESKQNERSLQKKLEELEKSSTESQESASKAEELEKANAALQNTVDHLEHRLEMANVDKLDAEEQLFIFTSKKSPFDLKSTRSQSAAPEKDRTQASHLSMSTIFSSDSPIGPNESQEPTTLAAFVAHIERLQEQIKEKDARIEELETENDGLQLSRAQVEMEMKGLSPQLDMLNKKSKQNEVHIEQLRTAIIDRESIIGEKEKAIRAVERQLEHHKLLLQAEIRKHATMSIMANSQAEPLPDLNSLTSKADIDRWIERLQARLKKDKGVGGKKDTPQSPEDAIGDLRKEIDFYVHEIIYYKLDIKGYKSDIKKLKHASRASRMSDMDSIKSNTPSLAPSGDTPINARFPSGASGLGISTSPSPVSTGPISATISIGRPITPPLTIMTPEASPKKDTAKMITMTAKRVPQQLTLRAPATPQTPKTPPCQPGVNIANEADNIDPGISPRSVARLSPERRKPTPPSPDQEKFGELATNFPLSTPASPKKHPTQRSLSESIIKLCSTPRTPERSPSSRKEVTTGVGGRSVQFRGRSASVPDASKAKTTPERPPRPRYGLFDSPVATGAIAPSDPPSPPRMDVLAEAMRHSPDQNKPSLRVPLERGLSNSSGSAMSAPSPDKLRSSLANPKSLIPSPLALRPRAGSAESNTANIQPLVSSPERKLSSSSSSNTPFVISMGSPHNPALIQPITTIQPTTCSITAKNSSLKVTSPTSRTGLCGTMASSMQTPSPKPTATQTSKALPLPPTGTASTTASQSQPQPRPTLPLIPRSRNGSISSMTKRKAVPSNNKNEPVAPRTPGHSRNASAPGSFRSAMQLSGSLSLIKGKGKSRKEGLTAGVGVGRSMSISHPRPLASPFDIDRSVDDGRNGKNDEGKVIGMAV